MPRAGHYEVAMRILVVEDDPVLQDGLKAGLSLLGAAVDTVSCCADGRAALATHSFDVIVLDLMLPDGSGLCLLSRIRAAGNTTPVLLLTALDEVADRIKGLDAGADDYLGKAGRATPRLTYNGIELDPATLTSSVAGKTVSLSRREFAVLASLMERPGTIRSKSELEESLYGWQEEVESNAVEVHIHNLRNKIGREAIETVRGIGYRMRKAKL
jgi:DNA-binding response OmpR family regulator